MRAFLEEYGIAIFVIAVIAILVLMATPIGKVIKSAIMTKVNQLRNDNIHDNGISTGGEF